MSEKTSIDGCRGRIVIGEWGKADPELKLQRCANEVRDDSRCGSSFFFRENRGKCFCEKQGAQCPRDRENSWLKNEYVLKNGKTKIRKGKQGNRFKILIYFNDYEFYNLINRI